MSTAKREDGFALVAAIALLTIMLGLGLGLLMFGDNQQKASTREQSGEKAFAIAEAALNAQVDQLSRVWPTKSNFEKVAVSRCTEAASTTANYCPPTTAMNVAYGSTSGAKCPAGTPADAWGAPITTPWATYVRSAKANSSYFDSKAEREEAVDYAEPEANEEKLWVRSVGVANCRVVSLVTLVSRQLISVPFPKDVLGGNYFNVTNKGLHGGKPIVVAEWKGESGEIGMRCEGLERGPGSGTCQNFSQQKEQVKPFVEAKSAPSSPIFNEEQLEEVRSLAETKGTLYSAARGNCPTSMEQLSGSPAYVEGCGNIQVTTGTANSATSPGFLVMADGTLTLKGNGTFYGVIYVRNPTNSAEPLVELGGAVTVVGAVEVDGKGGINLGSDSVNIEYNPTAIIELKGSAGATPTRNTFRVLPITQ